MNLQLYGKLKIFVQFVKILISQFLLESLLLIYVTKRTIGNSKAVKQKVHKLNSVKLVSYQFPAAMLSFVMGKLIPLLEKVTSRDATTAQRCFVLTTKCTL